jgi:Ribosome-binding factor A
LQHARKFIQHEVADILDTRSVPTLEFHYDESIEGAERISAILKEIDQDKQSARLNPEAKTDSGSTAESPADEDGDSTDS